LEITSVEPVLAPNGHTTVAGSSRERFDPAAGAGTDTGITGLVILGAVLRQSTSTIPYVPKLVKILQFRRPPDSGMSRRIIGLRVMKINPTTIAAALRLPKEAS
jgi:hypothetical protein